MGITKLMHMKESQGVPHTHLKNGLVYILDEKNHQKKTGDGVWVGGNCGTSSGEILQQFLQTKDAYGKKDGRQGYHFVISFKPGECDEQKAYNIAKEFCEKYLGDKFDYVFAVHNDKAHMHAHIIFNSVSRIDGYKYHYKEGDWKKYIQPVTDQVCIKYRIAPLEFDQRKGVSYAQWLAQKHGGVSKKEILYADVDYALERSETWEHFLKEMGRMGYTIKEGYSRTRKCSYLSFQPPVVDGKRRRAWRSYTLGGGYSKGELIQRMGKKNDAPAYRYLTEKMTRQLPEGLKRLSFSHSRVTVSHKRLYQAVNYYNLPNPYAVPAVRVRQDMLQIQKMSQQCMYLEKNNLHSRGEIEQKKKQIQEQINVLKQERKVLYGVRRLEEELTPEQQEEIKQCRELLNDIFSKDDQVWEKADDVLNRLEEKLPSGIIENEKRLAATNAVIRKLQREEKLLDQIMDMDAEGLLSSPKIQAAKNKK